MVREAPALGTAPIPPPHNTATVRVSPRPPTPPLPTPIDRPHLLSFPRHPFLYPSSAAALPIANTYSHLLFSFPFRPLPLPSLPVSLPLSPQSLPRSPLSALNRSAAQSADRQQRRGKRSSFAGVTEAARPRSAARRQTMDMVGGLHEAAAVMDSPARNTRSSRRSEQLFPGLDEIRAGGLDRQGRGGMGGMGGGGGGSSSDEDDLNASNDFYFGAGDRTADHTQLMYLMSTGDTPGRNNATPEGGKGGGKMGRGKKTRLTASPSDLMNLMNNLKGWQNRVNSSGILGGEGQEGGGRRGRRLRR